MTAEEIFKSLSALSKQLPKEALREAQHFPQELTPLLLESLVSATAHPERLGEDPTYQLPFFAMYLLAIWQEPKAHPLLVNFLRLPGELPVDVSGDIVTQDMLWMLAQTSGGDTRQIEAIAVDRAVNVWCRSSAINALTWLALQGALSREKTQEQFQRIVEALRVEAPAADKVVGEEVVLGNIACDVLDLQLVALKDDILTFFQEGRIDESLISRGEFKEEIGEKKPKPAPKPVTDVLEALSWWNTDLDDSSEPEELEFDDNDASEAIRIERPQPQSWTPAVPFRAPPTPGRNDPCPCGSGKKYKKCCGR